MTRPVFKVFRPEEQRAFDESDGWRGSAHDMRDGFVHLSLKHQVQGVVERHFDSNYPLHIAAFDAAALGGALKFESSSGGEDYPHLYAPLNPSDRLASATLGSQAELLEWIARFEN